MVKTWQVVFGTIIIFVAGLVTGGAVALRAVRVRDEHRKDEEARYQAQPQPPANSGRPLARPYGGQEPQFGVALIRRFANQLGLTPAQLKRINPIVTRTQEELARLRRETQLSTALTIERMQDEIAAVLNPEQRGRFEDLLKRQRARLQDFIDERNRARTQPAAGGRAGKARRGSLSRRCRRRSRPRPRNRDCTAPPGPNDPPRPGAMHGQAREPRQGRKAATVPTSS